MSTSEALSSGVLELVLNAGPIAKVVLAILLLFSIISWALIVEKWWQLRRVRRQTLAFTKIFREGRRPAVVHAAARKYRDSPLAQVYAAAYAEVSGVPDVIDTLDDGEDGVSSDRLEAVHRAMRRTAGLEIAQLERYLPFLATTASATPFIGLFGTVWGIMSSFHGISTQGSASLAVVAPGISEALIATAAGLAAAIPAVMGYNYFVNRVRHWATEMDGFILDLLNMLSRPVAKLARPAKDGI
ncbi:MAG TPA: protein TolQ [Methylomirabilota bacterium]|nr:protein TolQ [Methylomirabilota bacterium]